jgi:YgiT-type zinc finger domain-containing protein
MMTESVPACGEHHVPREWRPSTFEYHEGSISVRVPNVYAWVCPVNGEASFTAETVDEIVVTARELLDTAKRAAAPVGADGICCVRQRAYGLALFPQVGRDTQTKPVIVGELAVPCCE